MAGDPAAPFRVILPAPGWGAKQSGDEGTDDGSNSSPVANQRRLLKRIHSVTQACQICRQMKAKCDGGRPRCGHCIDRDRQCGYEGEVGQSRQAAMRARLAAFEAVFASLRAANPSETERLLQRLRTIDDPVSVLREESSGSPSSTSNSGPTSSGSAASANTQQTSPGVSPNVSPANSAGMGSGTEKSMDTSPRQSVEHLLNNDDDQSSMVPVAIELSFPDYETTTRAVAEFYDSQESLFQVFSEEETGKFIDIVFGASPVPVNSEEKNIAMSCLAGVAAVGMRYSQLNYDRFSSNAVYDIAKLHFELILDTSPFLATKIAVLLAMYNAMNRNTMALIWIGTGLRLSRTCGLGNKIPADPTMPMTEWTKHRKTWRTLVFMSCFLSFAMCSVTGQEVEFEKTSPTTLEFESSPDIREVIQTETTKIVILKVEILRIHLTFKKITALSFESVSRDLQSWYDKLPPVVLLGNLPGSSLPPDVLRSSYHLHLLYMGARLLIYRRMASQYSHVSQKPVFQQHVFQQQVFQQQVFQQQVSRQISADGPEIIPEDLLKQGIEAARTSAAICSFLMQDEAMFKRCWIVILQAYATCIVLLHIVAQKQAHGCHWETWQGDLGRIKVCLQLLSHYSVNDDVVREFYGNLAPYYLELSKVQVPFGNNIHGRSALYPGHENQETVPLLLTLPEGAPAEHTRIPRELMAMLGQPFGNLQSDPGSQNERRPSMGGSFLELPHIPGLRW